MSELGEELDLGGTPPRRKRAEGPKLWTVFALAVFVGAPLGGLVTYARLVHAPAPDPSAARLEPALRALDARLAQIERTLGSVASATAAASPGARAADALDSLALRTAAIDARLAEIEALVSPEIYVRTATRAAALGEGMLRVEEALSALAARVTALAERLDGVDRRADDKALDGALDRAGVKKGAQ